MNRFQFSAIVFVLFFALSSLVMGQADTTMTITSEGDVGIGTTTTTSKLYVPGTGYFSNTVTVATPTASTHATTKSYVDGLIGGGVGTGTSGQTLRHNGTSWIANSVLYNNGTNIGIGTLDKPEKHLNIDFNTMEKGYFESGLLINNIIDLKVYNLGLGVFYRYGPYSLEKTFDNFAFKFTMVFPFGKKQDSN